ncbi:MAG: TonB-dependent receptor [Pelistega sp.]|nr:TonB-dependent receptor [Pelistega sp.]
MKIKQSVLLLVSAYLSLNMAYANDSASNDITSVDDSVVTELEPIVVYSRGLKESRLDAPFMIDVIDYRQIERRGFKNVMESLASLPSINIHNGGNASTSSIWVRGVGSLTNTSMDDNSVDVVVDGVSNGKTGLARPLLDVERVEVAKGPQGTLFGSKSEAGNVIIKTVDPHSEFESHIGTRLGNHKLRGINGVLNVPLSDEWSFRIAAQAEVQDDYIKDSDTGRPLNNKKNNAVQAKLRWNDNERNDAILSVYYDERKNDIPIILSDPFNYSTKTNGLSHNAYRKNAGISLKFKHEFDFATLESTTAYHRHRAHVYRPLRPLDMLGVLYDSMGIPAPMRPLLNNYYAQGSNNRQNINERLGQFSQEFKLVSELDSGLAWVAGVYLEKRKRDFNYDAIRGIYLWDRGPTDRGPVVGADPFNAVIDREFNFETKAIFGELTLPVTEALKIIAGARYSHESLKYTGTWTANPNIPKSAYTEKHKISDSFLSGRLGINYALTPEWRIYALQSFGNKFGGFADYGTNIAFAKDNHPYKAAKIVSSEIGTKFLSEDGSLGFDLALFNNKVKDDHVTTVLYPSYLTGTGNADTRTRGVETGVFWQMNEQWRFKADMMYLNTKVTRVPTESSQITTKGNQLPQAAKFSGSLGISYNSKPFHAGFLGESQFLGDVNIRYVGSRYAQPDNIQKLPSYVLLDASMGIQSKHHDLVVWTKNLTNRKYHAFGIMPGYAGLPAMGRTVGLNYSYKF